jgi:hypothetical protein
MFHYVIFIMYIIYFFDIYLCHLLSPFANSLVSSIYTPLLPRVLPLQSCHIIIFLGLDSMYEQKHCHISLFNLIYLT